MKLSRAIRQYVAMKHVMGISYKEGTEVLEKLCAHVGDFPLRSIAKWQVLGFLERSVLSDVTWLFRYRNLKAFFEYWTVRGELNGLPLPPPRHPGTARTVIPCIYSVSEVRQLLSQAALKRHPRRSSEFSAVTFRTLLVFLYGTGARISEALSLRSEDVDLRHGTVTFDRSVANGTRTVPIGPHLCKTLREYVKSLDTIESERKHFFVGRDGTPIRPVAVTISFQTLRRKAGISRPADISRQPRVQDLRRTFAVHCMRAWLKEGKDLGSMLPILGTYLGHASLTSTEAYLAVTPERFLTQLSHLGPANENPVPKPKSVRKGRRPRERSRLLPDFSSYTISFTSYSTRMSATDKIQAQSREASVIRI